MWAETGLFDLFYRQPIWIQWWLIFLVFILAYLAGVALQRLMLREPCTESESALVGSALGLLAFLIGFTFSIAISRYDERRNLILTEANAIGTTWLRARLLPEPLRDEMQQILIRYTDKRLALYDVEENPAELRRINSESLVELERLWEVTTRAVKVIEPAPLAGSLVQTVNETIDLAQSRYTTYVIRIPRPVLFYLIGFAMLTAALSGFVRGGRRHFILSILTYGMSATVIVLIFDLDRPLAGAIRLIPGPLLDARAAMSEPEPTSGLPAP